MKSLLKRYHMWLALRRVKKFCDQVDKFIEVAKKNQKRPPKFT